MRYKCWHCGAHMDQDEVVWKPQYVNSEAWGVVANQKSEYATCINCESDDVGEVEEKDPDDAQPSGESIGDSAEASDAYVKNTDGMGSLNAVLVDIARSMAMREW